MLDLSLTSLLILLKVSEPVLMSHQAPSPSGSAHPPSPLVQQR